MATLKNGINGVFSGKVGTVVGVNSRVNPHMRSLPKKSSIPPSVKQLTYRARFATVSRFLAPLAKIQDDWYAEAIGVKSRRNLSQSYHVSEAVSGSYPDIQIDYAKVLVTRGELPGVSCLSVTALPGTGIRFEWQDNSGLPLADSDDLFLVVVQNKNSNQFIFEMAAKRGTGTFSMPLPEYWANDDVHCWVSFLSSGRHISSNSAYLGIVITGSGQLNRPVEVGSNVSSPHANGKSDKRIFVMSWGICVDPGALRQKTQKTYSADCAGLVSRNRDGPPALLIRPVPMIPRTP